jgi:hypothetical protein
MYLPRLVLAARTTAMGGRAGHGGPSAVTRSGERSLTASRQIGERLFISANTASVHVSNILTKTRLASRHDIADWARSNGLLAPLRPC